MLTINDLKENIRYKIVKLNTSRDSAGKEGQIRIIRNNKFYIIGQTEVFAGALQTNLYDDWEFMLAYPESIEEAAKQLDAHCPGWADKIVLSTLNMRENKTCILGQVFGLYTYGIDTLYGEDFDNDQYDTIFGTSANTDKWKKEIASRTKQSMEKPKALTYIEAWQALTEGKKIRGKNWGPGIYWHNDDGISITISWQDGTKVNAPLYGMHLEWEIYEEPQLRFSDLKAGDKFVQKGFTKVYIKAKKDGWAINNEDYLNIVEFSNNTIVEKV